MKSLYLKGAVWDFVLTFAVSLGMCYTLLNCFYVSPDLQYGPVPAIVCAVVLLALFAGASSKRAARIAFPLIAVAMVVSWIAAASMTPDAGFLVDNESNYLIFAMCTTLTATGCFALSRSLTGSALLFIAGAFIMGLVEFLYRHFEVAWTLVFVAAVLALIVYRNYQKSLRESSSVKKVAFVPGFAVAAVAGVVAMGLGCGIWFGIIAPLNPPAAEIKLLTEHRALETVRVKGVADIYQVPNLDMTSDETNDGERTTDDIKESPNGRPYPATGNSQSEDNPEDSSQSGVSFAGINLDVPDDAFDFLNYEQVRIALIIAALLLVAAIVAYFLGRRKRRARRLARVRQLPPSEQVAQLYPFLVNKLARLDIVKAPGQTLADYAVANAATMEQFDTAAGVTFAEVTKDYAAVVYGGYELDQEAADRAGAYYNAFWKACRHKIGNVKYFFKSFRL